MSETEGCPGQVVVTLERYGYEGLPYTQTEVWSLAVECSLAGCYWLDPKYDERRTTLTRNELIDLQSLHDTATKGRGRET